MDAPREPVITAEEMPCASKNPVTDDNAKQTSAKEEEGATQGVVIEDSAMQKPIHEDSATQQPIEGNGTIQCPASETNANTAVDDSAGLDPFAYTKQDMFTSEIFKIEVKNLPKHFGIGVFRKRLQNLKLDPVKVKGAGPKSNYVFVTFRNEDERKKALEVLDGHQWKGCTLKAKFAKASADPLIQKRRNETNDDNRDNKKQKVDPNLSLEDRLRNAVAPFWKVPYEKQLEKKQDEIKVFMRRLAKEVDKNNKDAKSWLEENRKLYDNMCCQLEDIKPSPVLNNYRNKCEFTIGVSEGESSARTVGFRLSSYTSGSTCVAPPYESMIVPKEMEAVVKCLETYIRESAYDVFAPHTFEGYWRQLTVRTSKKGDIMAIVFFHPQNLTEELIEAEKLKLKEYFTSGPGSSSHVTSMFFQRQLSRTVGGPEVIAMEWLFGENQIWEELLGMTFRISPDAFFQTNTLGAETLYSTIADWCNVSSDSYVLDVCCGTGTIGLTMAKSVERVLGIEMSQQAIDDAKHNAELNCVSNASYHCGKAEDVLPNLVHTVFGKKAVAVVDPPRPGLHNKVVYALRKSPFINRLVYVSCNPNGALNNLVDFMRAPSNRVKGVPFKPVKAVAVDMFPHTKHCELLILLERNCTESKK